MQESIPSEYRGWWRIIETSQWVDDGLDILGTSLLSLTGYDDRLGMHCLLAYVNRKPTKTGVSFTWEGAWELVRFQTQLRTRALRPWVCLVARRDDRQPRLDL